MFKNWDELTLREQLLSTISDVSKEARGYRWRGETDHLSDEQLQEVLDGFYQEAEREAEFERQMYAESIETFEENILSMIAYGAGDRETAIRWILSTFDEDDQESFDRDPGYFNYEMRLPYTYDWREGKFPKGVYNPITQEVA